MLGLLISAVTVTILLLLQRTVGSHLTPSQKRLVLVVYLIVSAAVVVALYQAEVYLSRGDVVGLTVGGLATYGLESMLWDRQTSARRRSPH